MIEDPDLPIFSYSYSAARERLLELGIRVSLSTIIYASLHRWSPFSEVKWTLISSLDDYSRKILYADFFEDVIYALSPQAKRSRSIWSPTWIAGPFISGSGGNTA